MRELPEKPLTISQKFLKEFCGIDERSRGEKVTYEKDVNKLLSQKDLIDLLIFLPPLSIEAILKVADAGTFLPQKATFFYPKLASGLLLRNIQA